MTNQIQRIEKFDDAQRVNTVDTILALWAVLMKKIGVPPNSIPDNAVELSIMRKDVEKLLIRYGKYELKSITLALNKGATNLAEEIAKRATTAKPIFPSVTIGHLKFWLEKYAGPIPDYTLNALPSDGLTPDQREIEESWQGDPLEVAKSKVLSMIKDCEENGLIGAARVRSLLKHRDNKQIFKAIFDGIEVGELAAIVKDIKAQWRGKIMAEFAGVKFKSQDGVELRPDQVKAGLIDRNRRKGGNERAIEMGWTDYELMLLPVVLRAFAEAQGINKMEVVE